MYNALRTAKTSVYTRKWSPIIDFSFKVGVIIYLTHTTVYTVNYVQIFTYIQLIKQFLQKSKQKRKQHELHTICRAVHTIVSEYTEQ